MSYNNRGYRKGINIKEIIIFAIVIIILAVIMKVGNRYGSDMVYISNGYCYHKYSHIIYIESGTSPNMTYTPYYDENGNMVRYNPTTEQWISIDNSTEEE